jgi:putative membrane protein
MWLGIHNGTEWWMAFAGIWMLIFWGPIIALAVWGIISQSRSKDQPPQREDPLEIAQHRYAQGEITREQFEEIKATLKQQLAIRN